MMSALTRTVIGARVHTQVVFLPRLQRLPASPDFKLEPSARSAGRDANWNTGELKWRGAYRAGGLGGGSPLIRVSEA